METQFLTEQTLPGQKSNFSPFDTNFLFSIIMLKGAFILGWFNLKLSSLFLNFFELFVSLTKFLFQVCYFKTFCLKGYLPCQTESTPSR